MKDKHKSQWTINFLFFFFSLIMKWYFYHQQLEVVAFYVSAYFIMSSGDHFKLSYPTGCLCISKEINLFIWSCMILKIFLAIKHTFSILGALVYLQNWTVLIIHNILHPFRNCLHKIPLMTAPISTHSFTHTFFCICEIPFFKWIWKIIPLIVPTGR